MKAALDCMVTYLIALAMCAALGGSWLLDHINGHDELDAHQTTAEVVADVTAEERVIHQHHRSHKP